MVKIDHGLLVDDATSPPTCIGYIFNFQGHGTYAPSGKVKVGDAQLTEEQVKEHNRLLAEAEWQAMLTHGRGVLYYDGKTISDWPGLHTLPKSFAKESEQFVPNAGRRCKRVDVWFSIQGQGHWHGIQRGDNSILRVRRLKGN